MANESDPPGVRAQVRHAVLETAARVLAENDQASIDDIARASGVGRASLYRWFTSREQLIDAILEQIIAEAVTLFTQVLSETSIRPLKALQRLAHELLVLGERYRFMRANLDRVREEEMRATFTEFIAVAQAGHELRDEVPADWVSSTFSGLILAAGEDIREGRFTRLQAGELIDRTLARLLDPD